MSSVHGGVDVGSEELEVVAHPAGQSETLGSFANEQAGFEQMQRQLEQAVAPEATIHLVLEPSGGYELALVAFARQQGWAVSLPNPWQVRRWAEGRGYRAKTDRVDARLLAEFGADQQPTPQGELPEAVATLDELLRRKQSLEKMLRQERNRQHSLAQRPHLPEAVAQSLTQVIEALEQALAEIEAEIAAQIRQDEAVWQMRTLLLTVAGVGEKTVLPLLVFLYRWEVRTHGQGDAKGLTAFSGLDPAPFQSGKSVHKRTRISKKGDGRLRAALVAAVRGGIRAQDSPLVHFYRRLLGRHKPKLVAQVAAARKILVWSWAVFQQRTPFDPAKALPAS